MASLAEIRQQYPQYSDMSDKDLADALHRKFYADMPADDFYRRIGLLPPEEDRATRSGFIPQEERKTRRVGGKGGTVLAQEPADLDLGYRALKGLSDIPAGGAQLLTHALPEGVVGAVNRATAYVNELPVIGPVTKAIGMTPATAEQIDQDIAQSNQAYEEERRRRGGGGFDAGRMAGNIAATLPVAAALPVGAGVAGATAAGAAGGGLTAALMPVTDQSRHYWDQKGEQIAIGTATGGALGGGVNALANVVAPRVNQAVRTLMDRGVTPTPGQILGGGFAKAEDKLTSVPVLGSMVSRGQQRAIEDFNRAVYDDVLAPIGARVRADPGRDAVAAVEEAIDDAYGRILPNVHLRVDQQLASDIGNLRNLATNLPPNQAARFEQVYRNDVLHRLQPTGTMDGVTFKQLESQLGKLATGYRKSADADQKLLGDALFELRNVLRQSLARTNPQYAPQLQAANESWARLVRLQKAAGSVGQDNPGIFTPAQFQSAVKASDQSVRKSNFATGDALMQDLSDAGREVLGSRYPNSGTPGRLGLMGLLLGGGYIEPTTAIATGALTLPYTRLGQRALAALLAQRPQGAAQAATYMRQLAPALRQAVVPGLLGSYPSFGGGQAP